MVSNVAKCSLNSGINLACSLQAKDIVTHHTITGVTNVHVPSIAQSSPPPRR